jgi:hypothetical protein
MAKAETARGQLEVDMPERRAQDIVHWSTADIGFIAFSFLFTLILVVRFQGGGLVLGFILFALGWTQVNDGRIYYVLVVVAPINFWVWVIQRNIMWEAEPKYPRLARLVRLARPPTTWMAINRVGKVAIIFNEKENVDTLKIGGTGSDTSALHEWAQRGVLDDIAYVLKRIAAQEKFQVTTSFQCLHIPQNPYRVAEVMSGNYLPDALPRPDEGYGILKGLEKLTDEQLDEDIRNSSLERNRAIRYAWVSQQNRETLQWARTGTRQVYAALSITIKRDRVLNDLRKGKSLAEDEKIVVEEIARVAAQGLRNCGFDDAHPYDFEEMHRDVHYALHADPTEYNRMVAETPVGQRLEVLRKSQSHGPQRLVRATRKFYQVDDTWHFAVRITEQPKRAQAHTFRPLFAIAGLSAYAVTLIGQTVRTRREVKALNRARPMLETARGARRFVSPEVIAKSRELARYHERMYTARFNQKYNVVIAGSAKSKREAEAAVDVVLDKVYTIGGLEASQIKGRLAVCRWVTAAKMAVPN